MFGIEPSSLSLIINGPSEGEDMIVSVVMIIESGTVRKHSSDYKVSKEI